MSLGLVKNYDEASASWLIQASGEIDVSNCQELRDAIEGAYSEHPGNILVDMSDVNYLDSSGLGVFIGVYGDMRTSGHRLILTEPRENVAKLLKITNLDKVLC
jgi:anti-sigma B factor antagonist